MYTIKDCDRAGDRAGDRHEWAGDRHPASSKLANVIAFVARCSEESPSVIRESARRLGRPTHHEQIGQIVSSDLDLHEQRRASSLDGRDDRGALEVAVREGVLATLRAVLFDEPENVRWNLAYVLVHELRRVGLRGTALARAQVTTIRTRLLKLGGVARLSVRRLVIALSGVFPLRTLLIQALRNIQAGYPLRC